MKSAYLINGKEQAQLLKTKLSLEVGLLKKKHIATPGLAVIMVGNHAASAVYVTNKIRACEEVGIASFKYTLESDVTQKQLLAKIELLNKDPKVHGILVQLPLPPHIDNAAIIDAIHPDKDVDGFHADNMGRLVTGQSNGLIPCTPMGCHMLLKSLMGTVLRPSLAGYKAVIVGRSNIVGKPMALLLLHESCTVTVVHSKTMHIQQEIQQADILVTALGKPHFVQASWIKPGAVVIDVGINRITTADGQNRLVGDVDFEAAQHVAAAITPVPGGVGPMTIACLMYNTIKAFCLQKGIPMPGQAA